MSFTSERTARRVPRYRPPTLFEPDGGPDHDLPSQARPATTPAPRQPRERVCRLYLELDGELLTVKPHRPDVPLAGTGIGGLPRRYVDLKAGRELVARLRTDPEGVRCSCNPDETVECDHAAAAIAAGLFPEVALFLDVPVATAGGEP